MINTTIVRGSIVKFSKTVNINPIEIHILDNARKTNMDYKIVLEEYKPNENVFIFLDPPYLFSDNSGYEPQQNEQDMTHMISYIYEYLQTCKCKVMLIINKLEILEWIFEEFIKGSYERIYQISKKKMGHLIITNYN